MLASSSGIVSFAAVSMDFTAMAERKLGA